MKLEPEAAAAARAAVRLAARKRAELMKLPIILRRSLSDGDGDGDVDSRSLRCLRPPVWVLEFDVGLEAALNRIG